MGFKYFLILYGIGELIFGLYVSKSKNENLMRLLVEGFSGKEKLDYDSMTHKKEYSKWAGQMILLGGASYVFIASLAIYLEISGLIALTVIMLIEVIIFKKIIREHTKFI